ncbi:MAG: D-sedoheptulose 7-phosphate isomerase [Desulfobulbaceae bacterium]|nr:D-sedoheptulose 7-phosphate isomerase [Desulfobulbaceae bacterium]
MKSHILSNLAGSIRAQQEFAEASADRIVQLVQWTVATFRSGGKLLLFGNGGSAADAQHVAAEFVNRFKIDRHPLPAIALTTDSSVLTSIGNDFSFDLIFVKQIQALGKRGDLALGISTSGNSPNVLKAITTAREMGLRTAALTGGSTKPGGEIGAVADLVLNVPSDSTPHIQEAHLWVEHILCELVEKELFA